MIAKTTEELQKLRDSAQYIVKNLQRIPEVAANWNRLYCSEARKINNDDGDQYNEVIIEEADPSAMEIREAVNFALKDLGYSATYAITEW